MRRQFWQHKKDGVLLTLFDREYGSCWIGIRNNKMFRITEDELNDDYDFVRFESERV